MHILGLSEEAAPATERFIKERGSAVTLGAFDGMHLGHQMLFETAREECPEGSLAGIVSFYPNPKEFFLKRQDPESLRASLTSFRGKVRLATQYGFDFYACIPFTESLAGLSARTFIERYIVNKLHARVVVVGDDWCFGKGRSGTPEVLKELGRELGFRVVIVREQQVNGERVAARRVRDAVSKGDLDLATRLLGRPFQVFGRVVTGSDRGSDLGYPTANIFAPNQLLPPDGVYVTLTRIDGELRPSVTNVGMRPTFGGTSRVVEVHVLDIIAANYYGQEAEIQFLSRVRDEVRFPSADALIAQIGRDVAVAREYFASRKN